MEFEEIAEWVFEEFSPSVYRFLRSKVPDQGTAEELHQEVFAKLFHYKRERIVCLYQQENTSTNIREQFNTLVFNAAKDICADHYRKVTRRAKKAVEYEQSAASSSESPGPDRGLYSKEIRAKLLAAFSELSEKCRELLYLHYVDELKYSELAAATDTRLATVKTRLHRCKAEFRRIVEKGYRELIPD